MEQIRYSWEWPINVLLSDYPQCMHDYGYQTSPST